MCMCYEMERNAKKMLQTIEQINNVVNNFIGGVSAIICIIGAGVFLKNMFRLKTDVVNISMFM